MAELVYHLHARMGKRSSGRSAVAAAAYRSGTALEVTSENSAATRKIHDYTRRDAVLAAGIMVPKGAPRWAHNRQKLWNKVEDAETRKDAQLFREIDVALPHTLPLEFQEQLLQGFIQQHFVSKGMIADYAIHFPTRHNDKKNIHAHIMLTTRELDGNEFAAKKNRDWNKKQLLKQWRKAWELEVNSFLAAHFIDDRIDHRSNKDRGLNQIPTRFMGSKVAAMERSGIKTAIGEFNEKAREYNRKHVLDRITEKKSVFTVYDIRQALLFVGAAAHVKKTLQRETGRRHIPETELQDELDRFLDSEIALLKKDKLVSLREKNGCFSALYTTKEIRLAEEDQCEIALSLGKRTGYSAKRGAISAILEDREAAGKALYDDQKDVLNYVVSDGGFKVVEGLAGTGKSFTLSACRDVLEKSGKRVIGLSHTNTVVQDMASDGFKEAYTISRFLYDLEKPQEKRTLKTPDENSVLIVDEAAMLSLKQDAALFETVKNSGAKLVYVGDSGQLESIDRGGMFAHYATLLKAKKLTTITRQRESWDREAAADFAAGRFKDGLLKYKKNVPKHIKAALDEDLAIQRLVGEWIEDTPSARSQRDRRFIFAYTNDQVNRLNEGVHQAEIESGFIKTETLQRFLCPVKVTNPHTGQREIKGNRSVTVGVGTRLQFHENSRNLGVFNGSLGRVTGVSGTTITVMLDKPGPRGSIVSFDFENYNDFSLGYAGTIYKGQGKTFDQAYVLFSKHWRRHASYVAMTRSRKPTKLFYARRTARSLDFLASQMGRVDRTMGASIAFKAASAKFAQMSRSFSASARPRSRLYFAFENAAKHGDMLWRSIQQEYQRTRQLFRESEGPN